MLAYKNLTHLLYVTLFFLSGVITLYSQAPIKVEKQVDILIQKLGASGFRERKQAMKDLIKLGYYARSKVQNALNSKDPEVRANALEVWNEIKNIITPHHSKEVGHFISQLKNNQAKRADWQIIMHLLEKNSLAIMIEIIATVEFDAVKNSAKNQEQLTKADILKGFIELFAAEEIIKMSKSLSKEAKNSFAKIISHHLQTLSSYEQATLIQVCTYLITPKNSLGLLPKINLLSPLVVQSIDKTWLEFYKKDHNRFKQELKFICIHLLATNKSISKKELANFLEENPLSLTSDRLCSILFHFYSDTIEIKYWEELFENSDIPWHKLALLKVKDKLTTKEIEKLKFPTLQRRSQMLSLIDRFFYFKDPRAIPLLEKTKDLKQDKPSDLYNENLILMRYFSRIGQFEKAQEYLSLFNKSEGRKSDTNFNFFSDQKTKINEETERLLKKVATLYNSPEEALELLNQAIKNSPEVVTSYLQKAEIEVKLKRHNQAKLSIEKAANLLPNNALEFQELIYICLDIQESDLAKTLIANLKLEEENINNCIIAAGAHEFFGNRQKSAEYQQIIYMTAFGQVRDLFYDKKYELIPEKCITPEEGDFQYLWGIMAKNLQLDTTEARTFMANYSFTDNWPKLIAYMLIGKVTPEKLILECSSTQNVSEQRGRLTEAYFYIAGKLLKSDQEKAKEYLQKCLDLKFREYYEYISASPLLKSISK